MNPPGGDDFTLADAIAVLRLLDEAAGPTADLAREGMRAHIARDLDPPTGPCGAAAAAPGKGPARPGEPVVLRAPAAGRLRWSADLAEVPAPGRAILRVDQIVGRIEGGAAATVIASGVAGALTHAYAASGDFVEFGQALLLIEPSD